MSADSDAERSEAPTARKRQEARDEGRIPRSPELGTAALFLGTAFTVRSLGPMVGTTVMTLFGGGLSRIGDAGLDPNVALELFKETSTRTVGTVSTLGAGISALAIVVAAVQARGVLSTKPLAPAWERVSPMANAKKMFGPQALAELLKSLLKASIIGWAVQKSLGTSWDAVSGLAARGPLALLSTVHSIVGDLLWNAGLAYLALGAADYLWQLWQHEKGLRMTKEEVRLENRSQDGDPQLKARLRSMARSNTRRQMFKDVPTADVVLVNPTHIAIALKYDPMVASAPIVLAMGQRKIAERIKALAYEHGVPVIENKPLARALLASAHVGMMIPADLYAAVAEVLAFVIRRRALGATRWQERIA
ncbi:MAG: EscU/YscU/HrcU family type III secretion system export apparatus switch protein [Gemmatimonadaceae bacterium]|nr:EscU/YscU/HrcU family type III secretion system export apparatus switch protein [Gemmatimonadaceae bacterium]